MERGGRTSPEVRAAGAQPGFFSDWERIMRRPVRRRAAGDPSGDMPGDMPPMMAPPLGPAGAWPRPRCGGRHGCIPFLLRLTRSSCRTDRQEVEQEGCLAKGQRTLERRRRGVQPLHRRGPEVHVIVAPRGVEAHRVVL